jgi:isoquinoline 1-oxidoreductase beta subunit
VAKITGHDADQVTFHNQFIGGSFGHRLEFEHIKQATEIANRMRGTPVKLTYSREEDFAQDFTRHIAMGRARGRVIENGQVVAIDVDIAAPSVIASQVGRIGMSVPGPGCADRGGRLEQPLCDPRFPHAGLPGRGTCAVLLLAGGGRPGRRVHLRHLPR